MNINNEQYSEQAATKLQEVLEPAIQNSGAYAIQGNDVAFQQTLDAIVELSQNKREQGQMFETLTLYFFRYDKRLQGLYLSVDTYQDWAAKHPNLAMNLRDTGIDLVATNCPTFAPLKGNITELTFTAIQCKHYSNAHTIAKPDIDSFCNASDKVFFTSRILVVTTHNISDNALSNLTDKTIPVKIITPREFVGSSIDWSDYLKQLKTDKSVTSVKYIKRQCRDYQLKAIKDVTTGFKEADRGKLVMACGTGKTFTALKIAEVQTHNQGFILFLVPSIHLLEQTINEWKQFSTKPIAAFAVCSDNKVGRINEDSQELTLSDELIYPANTNAEVLASSVLASRSLPTTQSTPPTQSGLPAISHEPLSQTLPQYGMTVIFATYQSIDVVAKAQACFGLPVFDLIICDEAHRTTGCFNLQGQRSQAKQATYSSLSPFGTAEQRAELKKTQSSSGQEVVTNEPNQTVRPSNQLTLPVPNKANVSLSQESAETRVAKSNVANKTSVSNENESTVSNELADLPLFRDILAVHPSNEGDKADGTVVQDADVKQIVPEQEANEQVAEAEEQKFGEQEAKEQKAEETYTPDVGSYFTAVHDNAYIKSHKRLYMTATPKIFTDDEGQNNQGELKIFSMSDPLIYGPTFHVLSFPRAVELGCLVDCCVMILHIDDNLLPIFEGLSAVDQANCAKIIGTWKAVLKFCNNFDLSDNPDPMRRVVCFAQAIDSANRQKTSSKQLALYFQQIVKAYCQYIDLEYHKDNPSQEIVREYEFLIEHQCQCECKHIDGHMTALQKAKLIDWLKEAPNSYESRLLFNVRCLSEGVDLPALDGVVFLHSRNSLVDIIQIIGRSMRTAPGKKVGYVVIPIISTTPNHPEYSLYKNAEFKIVGQVINALKSLHADQELIDYRFNKLDQHIQIGYIKAPLASSKRNQAGIKLSRQAPPFACDDSQNYQIESSSHTDEKELLMIAENIKAMIIKRYGNSKSWTIWANDVAQIFQEQVQAITEHLQAYPALRQEFEDFRWDLSSTVRKPLSDAEVIEMISQHVVVKPVLDELFKEFSFTEQNPIAMAMNRMVATLKQEVVIKTTERLQSFYEAVALRMKHVQTLNERQTVIVELFDNFFKQAFPKQQEQLGIIYTPVEVVDFMNQSVNELLKKEFNSSLSAPNIHILDPFAGTGTFLARMLINLELITNEDLKRKYLNELHAFEIMPLSYYIASINIEAVYAARTQQTSEVYAPNHITVLTDTFATHQNSSYLDILSFLNYQELKSNEQMREQVDNLPLIVILGNPPYFVGQDSQNKENQQQSYPELEERIAETYGKLADNTNNKRSLYDSYIKAYRWASDHLGEKGIIAFISNAGWLDSISGNGMRQCLQQEFSSIYIYHLKGNQRTYGETSRKEGGKIFGLGCRSPIAITFLVKNPEAKQQGQIFFASVEDYLTREEKLNELVHLGHILNAPLRSITPDAYNDWFNQRNSSFSKFIPMNGKNTKGLAIFKTNSRGLVTGRDGWAFNASRKVLATNFTKCINVYNQQIQESTALGDNFKRCNDASLIKWDRELNKRLLKQHISLPFTERHIVTALYRPFFKEFLYNDAHWLSCRYQMPQLFPFEGAENLTIVVKGSGARSEFSCCMAGCITCLGFIDNNHCFPRYIYPCGSQSDKSSYFAREDAINSAAVEHFKQAYPEDTDKITADSLFYYVYGLLHSPDYRDLYANNMQKELPRIPRVANYVDFNAFEQAGRKLSHLHVNYEAIELFKGVTLEKKAPASLSNTELFHVEKLAYGKISGKEGNAGKDKTKIIYNSYLTISDIPLEAQEYIVNKKSALDWLVESCGITTVSDSGITNDYNLYAQAIGEEQYIFNLILRVITVSLETMRIVKSLPQLKIHPLDQ